MSLIFCDSFDHYNNLGLKWNTNPGAIDLTGTKGRTGIGAWHGFPLAQVTALSGGSATCPAHSCATAQ